MDIAGKNEKTGSFKNLIDSKLNSKAGMTSERNARLEA